MPKVSIVTTCYNQDSYVAETIESVISQTYTNWEMIIVDDASTDESINIIKKYQKQDKRIKLIQQKKNSGSPILPRNKGINEAHGDYILLLDSDDKIAPSCLEKMVNAMQIGLADVICCDVEYFGEKSGKMRLKEPVPINMYNSNCVVISSLFRKSDFESCGNFDLNCFKGLEDWDFWLNFIDKGKTFYRIPDTLFFYRITNLTRNDLNKQTRKNLRKYITSKHPVPIEYNKKLSLIKKIILFFVHLFRSRKTYKNVKSRYMRQEYPKIEKPKLIMTLLVRNEADIIRENL